MRFLSVLMLVVATLMVSARAEAQLFGRRWASGFASGYGTCASGNCGGSSAPMMMAPAPMVTAPRAIVNTSPVYAPRSSINSFAASPGGYSTAADGRVIAADGGAVCAGDGTPMVSRAWAEERIKAAEDAAMSFAAMPAGCQCPDYSADLAAIKKDLAEIRRAVEAPYREEQSRARREVEEMLARQAADRAIVQARATAGSVAIR